MRSWEAMRCILLERANRVMGSLSLCEIDANVYNEQNFSNVQVRTAREPPGSCIIVVRAAASLVAVRAALAAVRHPLLHHAIVLDHERADGLYRAADVAQLAQFLAAPS